MTKDSQSIDEVNGRLMDNVWVLMTLAVVLWMAYFALAYPPGGAPFIYAEF